MATWDITAPAGSGVGEGGSGSSGITPPGDFDGATITDVSVVGSPALNSDSPTDDSISVSWYVATDAAVAVYGSGVLGLGICDGTLGDSVSSTTIADRVGVSPAPSTAVGADWDTIRYAVDYTANMKGDAETCSWSSFTIRVTYTPAAPTRTVSGTPQLAAITSSTTLDLIHSISGSPAIAGPTTANTTVLTHPISGSPAIAGPVTNNTLDLIHPITATPSIASPTVAGSIFAGKPVSGTPSLAPITVAATLELTHPLTAAPSLSPVSVAATLDLIHPLSGSPAIASPAVAGTITVGASVPVSGTVALAPVTVLATLDLIHPLSGDISTPSILVSAQTVDLIHPATAAPSIAAADAAGTIVVSAAGAKTVSGTPTLAPVTVSATLDLTSSGVAQVGGWGPEEPRRRRKRRRRFPETEQLRGLIREAVGLINEAQAEQPDVREPEIEQAQPPVPETLPAPQKPPKRVPIRKVVYSSPQIDFARIRENLANLESLLDQHPEQIRDEQLDLEQINTAISVYVSTEADRMVEDVLSDVLDQIISEIRNELD